MNIFSIAHTEQEIFAIIQTSVFCVDKTCFLRPHHIRSYISRAGTYKNENHRSLMVKSPKLKGVWGKISAPQAVSDRRLTFPHSPS